MGMAIGVAFQHAMIADDGDLVELATARGRPDARAVRRGAGDRRDAGAARLRCSMRSRPGSRRER